MSRLGKLKGAIRGAIDGSSMEATEVPTVWDALTDEPQVKIFLYLFHFRGSFTYFYIFVSALGICSAIVFHIDDFSRF